MKTTLSVIGVLSVIASIIIPFEPFNIMMFAGGIVLASLGLLKSPNKCEYAAKCKYFQPNSTCDKFQDKFYCGKYKEKSI